MLRRIGMTNLHTILLELSRDPAMIFWLDNNENHKGEPNENYGRELLELFSMGVGNYSETDIKMAARAFTGWTFKQPIPLYPYGFFPVEFVYRPASFVVGAFGSLLGVVGVVLLCLRPRRTTCRTSRIDASMNAH